MNVTIYKIYKIINVWTLKLPFSYMRFYFCSNAANLCNILLQKMQ